MRLGCVAVPIFDSRRRVVAALSLTGTTRQISTARLPALGRVVKKYAQQMSARLKN
jgi:DNA-binding IclR family transcriptional regulator